MAPRLTPAGVFWVCLSLAAAILNSAGFYLPFWIKGVLFNTTEVSFGSFRRCNYPRVNGEGKLVLIMECGRYTQFEDIPSWAWQVATVVVGLGACLSLLVAFTSLTACCLSDVITKCTARILGAVQVAAAVLIVSGVLVYPQGWGNLEAREACGGSSQPFQLGACELSWSLYILGFGVSLLILCCGLSCKATQTQPPACQI